MRQTLFLAFAMLATLLPSAGRGQSPVAEPAPLDDAPKWYKGNLHTHSLWSDGNDYPEMIVDFYARRDYHFLALSDHNILGVGQKWMGGKRVRPDGLDRYRKRFGENWVETRGQGKDLEVRLKPLGEYRPLFERAGRFLLFQGEELTDTFDKKPVHMGVTNVLEVIPAQGGKDVSDVMANNLAAVEAQSKKFGQPMLAHLNHPNFRWGVTAEELAMVTREHFFEVYNGHPGTNQLGDATHAPVERMWDIMNTLRIGEMNAAPLYGLGTDDSHNYFGEEGSTPGRGWIEVRARFLTPESLIHAMEAGDFYASSGVRLKDVRYSAESRTLSVAVEPQGSARYTIRFTGTMKDYDRTRGPVLDAEGKPLPVTQRYSESVGKILATVEGPVAEYRLTGDELYVRATISSDQPPENPSFPGQVAQAWTQPVGWVEWLAANRPPAGAQPEATPAPR
ncbi:PHP domain-containing protein [Tundrisphaera sp. TA3]|uniref:PHP domain-containing protein n=1 Tax=Tundrisphaera sp. TA3 TaxID=3435775 RepID=UPI003EB87C44